MKIPSVHTGNDYMKLNNTDTKDAPPSQPGGPYEPYPEHPGKPPKENPIPAPKPAPDKPTFPLPF